MNRRRSLAWVVVGIVVLALVAWLAGGWLWAKLIEMHGGHGGHHG